MSPDGHALLGRAPQGENLYLANGSSGHGVMHSPAIGQLLAEIMLDGAAHTLQTHSDHPVLQKANQTSHRGFYEIHYLPEGGSLREPKTLVEKVW